MYAVCVWIAIAVAETPAFSLRNPIIHADFDSRASLIGISDVAQKQTHRLSGDGWLFELGDLPSPTGVAVRKDAQAVVNGSCPTLPAPPPMTTVEQCAWRCMATEGCEAWTASFDTWVTWGRPRLECRLHSCAGPFTPTDPTTRTSAGLKPATEPLPLTPGSCTGLSVSKPTSTTLEAIHSGCQGYRVNVTYELDPDWHFVTKHLSICAQAVHSGCQQTAGFTVRHVTVWPGVQLPSEFALGAMAMNPFSRKDSWGETMPRGSGETASFWRSDSGAGLFATIQNSFFESSEGFGAFHWGWDDARWAYVNYGAWLLGAAIVDTSNFHPAHVDGTLNIRGQTAKGGNDVALLSGGSCNLDSAVSIAVTLVEGQATNKPAAAPLASGYAGIVFGATAHSATATASASVDGLAAVVTLFQGKQYARFISLAGAAENLDAAEVLAEAALNVSSIAPLRMNVELPARLADLASLSIDGSVVLRANLSAFKKAGSGIGLVVLQQDASFFDFRSSASPSRGSPVQPVSPAIHGQYSPMMKQDPLLGAWHQADSGVLGLTQRTGYELPESGIDLGESQAFTRCVEYFLMDKQMRESGALRYQVAWDSNEYQLDMSRQADRTQYKRLIQRNSELGIKYMVFEPRNTAVSSRWDHTDEWWWEEVLWFQLGIGIRNGSWAPGRNPLPPTVAEMLDYFQSSGVGPAAYVYPTLAWTGEGEEEWLYESPQREAGDGRRASLASPKLQNYLIDTMARFLNVTGGSGFAWDYGIQGDTRVANLYQEVRGWLRVLAALRKAKPDIVMDHRQIAHQFGPWYHLAGSYSEPIAGDENPESYGATLASLSTDHILADNLRLTNYRYRLQLLPNDRVPGFMFHQTERHYDNGTGDDSNGRPGDKIDSNGNVLWKPDPIPDPHTGNYSGVTYGNCVVQHQLHTRDFDYLGFRYSVISTIGTAGRNLVVANVPARDIAEYQAFPEDDIAWIRKWFDWADDNAAALRQTMPLIGYEWPRLGRIDGTVAVVNNSGFVFLYNPGPDSVSVVLTLDQSLNLRAGSDSRWLISEIYPQERGVPLGIWLWKDVIELSLTGGAARIIKLVPWKGSPMPIAFNISCGSVRATETDVVISDASALAGSSVDIVVRVPQHHSATGLIVNNRPVNVTSRPCFVAQGRCLIASVKFGGSASLRYNAMAGQLKKMQDGAYTTVITVTSAMLAQLRERQARYNLPISKTEC